MRFTRVFCVFLRMASQCFSHPSKTALAFSFVWRHNTCVSHACLYPLRSRFPLYGVTMYAFYTRVCIGLYGCCVFRGIASQCMRFKWVSASVKTTSAFSLVWGHNACVWHACPHRLRRLLRRLLSQCMRFTRVSACIKTAYAFFLVWGHNACVSHAFLYRFKRFLCCIGMASKYMGSQASLYRCRRLLHFPWCGSVSHACLHRLKRLLRFPWYGVTMHAFHTRLCIG